jgi:hypothetical protein
LCEDPARQADSLPRQQWLSAALLAARNEQPGTLFGDPPIGLLLAGHGRPSLLSMYSPRFQLSESFSALSCWSSPETFPNWVTQIGARRLTQQLEAENAHSAPA